MGNKNFSTSNPYSDVGNLNVPWSGSLTADFNSHVHKKMYQAVLNSCVIILILTPHGIVLQSRKFGAETIFLEYHEITQLSGDSENIYITVNNINGSHKYFLEHIDTADLRQSIDETIKFIKKYGEQRYDSI